MQRLAKVVAVVVFVFSVGSFLARAQGPAKVVKLTDADNNKSIEVAVGQRIEIRLQGNVTTGYEWLLQPFPGSLELSDFSYAPAGKQMPGSGGVQSVGFIAKSPGSGDVKLEYRRPWEKDTPPARTFAIKITVR